MLHVDAQPYWNGSSFTKIPIQLDEYTTHSMCVASYALLVGCKGSTAQTALARIRARTIRWTLNSVCDLCFARRVFDGVLYFVIPPSSPRQSPECRESRERVGSTQSRAPGPWWRGVTRLHRLTRHAQRTPHTTPHTQESQDGHGHGPSRVSCASGM